MSLFRLTLLDAKHTPWTEVEGKLHTLEYYVSKAAELNDMMDPSKGTTGNVVCIVNEVLKDDEHFGKHVELDKVGTASMNSLVCLKNTAL